MSDKAEIRQLTALRGVAAMFVVMYHFKKEFGTRINLDSHTQIFECGYLWVDFFFILSGFVMGLVYADFLAWPVTPQRYRQFLIKRLARIYPLHIFTFALFIPIEAAKLFLASNAEPAFSVNSPGAMLSNILLIQAWDVHSSATWNQPAWSISAEWAAYLLTPILLVPVFRSRPAGACGLVGVLVAGLVSLDAFLGHGSLDFTHDFAVPRCVLSFTLGMLICRLRSEAGRHLTAPIGSAWSVIGSLIAVVLAMHFHIADWAIALLYCWLVAAMAMGNGITTRLVSSRPLYFLGVISYSIYLDHALVQRAWQFVWYKYASHHFNQAESVAALVCLLGLTVVLASLTYRFIEVPGRKNLPEWLSLDARRPVAAQPPS